MTQTPQVVKEYTNSSGKYVATVQHARSALRAHRLTDMFLIQLPLRESSTSYLEAMQQVLMVVGRSLSSAPGHAAVAVSALEERFRCCGRRLGTLNAWHWDLSTYAPSTLWWESRSSRCCRRHCPLLSQGATVFRRARLAMTKQMDSMPVSDGWRVRSGQGSHQVRVQGDQWLARGV